jgi:hypothetical protein
MKPVLLLIFSLVHLTGNGQFKVNRQYFEDLLAAKEYGKVFKEANALREQPYGKTSPLLCYFIGRSLCGRGFHTQGKEWYTYIKEQFPPDRGENGFWKELTEAASNCAQLTTSNAGSPNIIIINVSNTPSVPSGLGGGITGKGGFGLSCDKRVNENYDNLKKNDSLEKRIFQISQKERAINQLRTFLPTSYQIDSSGRFLVLSLATATYYHRDVEEVARKLEFAYQYFRKTYQIRQTNTLYTVYLLPGKYELQNTAKLVHDIKLSEANIGYSSLNDLSLLGIADKRNVGTLYHELFHLVIRTDIGDISPWLDEGLACLYSVYRQDSASLSGSYKTWRVSHFKLLTMVKSAGNVKVPTLKQLVNYSWETYQGGIEKNQCQASVNYALSNLFMLYLQSKQELTPVVTAFKDRNGFGNDSLGPGPPDAELLELALNRDIDHISEGFYDWLQEMYSIDLPALIATRPTVSDEQIPGELMPLFDSIDNLILEVDRQAANFSKKEISNVKNRRSNLHHSIGRDFERYQSERKEAFYASVEQNTDWVDRVDQQQAVQLKTRETELNHFIQELKNMVSIKGP